jgi:hypothetical protein
MVMLVFSRFEEVYTLPGGRLKLLRYDGSEEGGGPKLKGQLYDGTLTFNASASKAQVTAVSQAFVQGMLGKQVSPAAIDRCFRAAVQGGDNILATVSGEYSAGIKCLSEGNRRSLWVLNPM